MAYSKASMITFLVIVSASFFNLCHGDGGSQSLDQLLSGIGQSPFMKDAQCVNKLLPCHPFLKNPVNPPETCCAPLSEVATNSSECLCKWISNPKLFSSVEGSKEEILKLPNACGINVDDSKCNTAGGDLGTQDGTTNSSSSTKMITFYGITYFGIALLTALVFSAY